VNKLKNLTGRADTRAKCGVARDGYWGTKGSYLGKRKIERKEAGRRRLRGSKKGGERSDRRTC